MMFTNLTCPRCDATHQFLLSQDVTRHLRRCGSCDLWYVIDNSNEDQTAVEVESLGDPPTCPVDGCGATLAQGDQAPEHILDQHSGSLVPST